MRRRHPKVFKPIATAQAPEKTDEGTRDSGDVNGFMNSEE
jgi:hypothetical protein